MNFKQVLFGLSLTVMSILAGCNDEISSIGITIQPGNDTISVFTDTFYMEATTIKIDSIFARSTNAQLGELYDPLYGNLKSDFLCQFFLCFNIIIFNQFNNFAMSAFLHFVS